MNNKFDSLRKCHSLQKTLRFGLIPDEATKKYLDEYIIKDTQKANDSLLINGYMDRYHKAFIDYVLSGIKLIGVDEYARYFFMQHKKEDEKKKMLEIQRSLRTQIHKAFVASSDYSNLFGDKMIREILPNFLTDSDELALTKSFIGSSTYFSTFYTNRKNMYTDGNKETGIAHRCINKNLKIFLENMETFKVIKETLPKEIMAKISEEFEGFCGVPVEEIYTVDYFSSCLPQFGIDMYNTVIGGYTTSDGCHIEGINQYVNQYNQLQKKEGKIRYLKKLEKQILSDRVSSSFILSKFENDDDVLKAIHDFYVGDGVSSVETSLAKLDTLFDDFDSFNDTEVYFSTNKIENMASGIFGSWNAMVDGWYSEYDSQHTKKRSKNYEENRKNAYKKIKKFNIAEVERIGKLGADCECGEHPFSRYISQISNTIASVINKYGEIEELVSNPYTEEKKLCKNAAVVEKIKSFLDELNNLNHLLTPFACGKEELARDYDFYDTFTQYYSSFCEMDHLYNKVRNYITKKPYSKDKVEMNFGHVQIMTGWTIDKETVIMKDGNDYLVVVSRNKGCTNYRSEYFTPTKDEACMEVMKYTQTQNPGRFLPTLIMNADGITSIVRGKKVGNENPRLDQARRESMPPRIYEINRSESYKKNKDDLTAYIDYYKDCIDHYDAFKDVTIKYRPSEDYASFNEFAEEIGKQAYKVEFLSVSKEKVMKLVEDGDLLMFRIHTKDQSKYSKGTPNLYTKYLEILFDERNLASEKGACFKLNGGAKIYYRAPSLKKSETAIHPAHEPIANKNPDNPKTTSTMDYTLYKDKRYTEPAYSLHFSVEINYDVATTKDINHMVREIIKKDSDNYVIGIDRGERNLIYVTVVNKRGEIVEQRSLNVISSTFNGVEYKADYADLLSRRNKDCKGQKQSWQEIDSIKNIKEGYCSQAVHVICQLVSKYSAILAIEDLNSGFKGRNIEKQVYQRFENVLINKLNYCIDKSVADPMQDGGVLNAKQLACTDLKSEYNKQNGIVFYVPAWMTSKTDPTTGFACLFKNIKYKKLDESKDFFGRFDGISYDKKEGYFCFSFNYKNFEKCSVNTDKQWTICTYGERVKTFKNEAGYSDYAVTDITQDFINLFREYGIDYNSGNLVEAIMDIDSPDFYKRLTWLFRLAIQVRNSIPGDADNDYILSPVKNSSGTFYDSRNHDENSIIPCCADANGAYNIAKKAIWAINEIKKAETEDELDNARIQMSYAEWMDFAQENPAVEETFLANQESA